MQPPITPIGKEQTFCFACSPEVPCFNACCRDLAQALTPYDLLCLKKHLEITSDQFLTTYAQMSTGPGSGLPVATLRFTDAEDLACPFVSPEGCTVYAARPASCRTYPLARGLARDRSSGRLTEHWALIREPHCRGFEQKQVQRVDQWVDDQQIATHNRINDQMLELISLKNRFHPKPLPPSLSQQIYTALYDLDRFRRQLDDLEMAIDTQRRKAAGQDDLVLLELAMQWVRQLLIQSAKKEPPS